MATTTTLSSSLFTAEYRRTLNVLNTAPSPSVHNQYIAPSSANATNRSVYSNILGSTNQATVGATVAPGIYVPANTSGITWLTFYRAATINNVSADLAPDSSTTRPDYSDTINFDNTRGKATNSTGTAMTINNSAFVTGTEASNNNAGLDADLIFVGSASSNNGNSYNAGGVTIGGVAANSTRNSVAVNMQNTLISTGKDNDTLCFANDKGNIASNTFAMGTGSDYVYLANASTLYGGNTIDMGADTNVDSLRFGSGTLSNVGSNSSQSTALTLKNFGSNDRLIYNGTTYTGQSGIQGNTFLTSKIIFT